MDALKIDLILNNIFRFIPINQNKDLCLVDKQWYNHINIWFTYEFLWHRNQQFIEKHQTFDDLIELMEPTFCRFSGLRISICRNGDCLFLRFKSISSQSFFVHLSIPETVLENFCGSSISTFWFPKQFTTDNTSRLMMFVDFNDYDMFVEFLDLSDIRFYHIDSPKPTKYQQNFLHVFQNNFSIHSMCDTTLLDLPFVNEQKLLTLISQTPNQHVSHFNGDGTFILADWEFICYFSGPDLITKLPFCFHYDIPLFVCNHYVLVSRKSFSELWDIISDNKIMEIDHYIYICDYLTLTRNHFLLRCLHEEDLCKSYDYFKKCSCYYLVDINKKKLTKFREKLILSNVSLVQQLNDDFVIVHSYYDDNYQSVEINLIPN